VEGFDGFPGGWPVWNGDEGLYGFNLNRRSGVDRRRFVEDAAMTKGKDPHKKEWYMTGYDTRRLRGVRPEVLHVLGSNRKAESD